MSSHHFVKEGQEPALIVAHPVPFGVVSPFLEWAPLIIALENTADTVFSWGVKTDLIFCQPENANTLQEKTEYQQPISIVEVSEPEPLLIAACKHLIQVGQTDVSVAVCRPQEDIPKYEPFYNQINIVFFDDSQKWWRVKNGRFEKWLAAGTTVRYYAKSALTASGACKLLPDCVQMEEDSVLLLTSNDDFWVGENI